MPTPATPSAPSPAGDNRNAVELDEKVVVPGFEERLQRFWQNNSKLIAAVLIAVLLAIVAKGGWEYLQADKEREIGAAYAAATSPAQIKAFAAAHPDHSLGGVAHVRMADEAYGEGRFADAITSYEQAVSILEAGPLASRARLGAAMSKLQGGRVADGEAALKAIAADEKELKAYRAEAAYHLASHAHANGKPDDLKTYADQLSQLDPASPWTQRAQMLRANSAPSAPAAAATPDAAAPAITLPGSTK